jgi:CHAD domain-containing protein
MLEEERKYEVDDRFSLPDLSDCIPVGGRVLSHDPLTLRATYYDTADYRLARAGVSLRYRKGDSPDKVWTAKLPSDSPGTRHEICRAGHRTVIPAELVSLLTAYHRGSALQPAAVMRTVRRAHEIHDADGRRLVEIDDDAVSVFDGRRVKRRFREIEVERLDGGSRLLDQVEDVLCLAGARAGGFIPKHIRAMDEAASQPADVQPADRMPGKPFASDVIAAALRGNILRIMRHDPFVRLRQPLSGGDTPVHQMRVGCRRLRGDLRTFRPLLDREWADALWEDLRWLSDALGLARDAEVLRARLHATAAYDPLAPLEPAAVARIDADLTARHEEALLTLDALMESPRYVALLDSLVAAAREPRLDTHATVAARWVLPPLVAKPWRQLVQGNPEALTAESPDADWHALRILGKRARYAVEAVASVLGGAASDLAAALAAVQDLLGEHQDAAIAGDTWLAIAAADPDDHALAVTAGRLYERERSAVRRSRQGFDSLWHAVTRKRLTAWLR